jgi:NADPH2:quinone reductase
MKAIVMTEPGGPEVLRLQDVPEPDIRNDTELLIRIEAAGVNPVDTKLRSRGTYFPDRHPCILGCDAAGIVEQAGPAASRFKPGDEVYFCYGGIGGPRGNYARYAVVDERFVASKPANLSFAEAAAAPLVLITAWESLHDRARIQAGQKVLIHAGAGGVGHVAIQLAKLACAEVATTVSDPSKEAFVRELGADLAINYKQNDFVQEALAWSRQQGVDMVFDTVGSATFEKSFAATRFYGDIVTILQPGADTDWKIARLRNLRLSLELMLSPLYYGLTEAQQYQASILEHCAELFEDDQLHIRLSHTFPLEQAAEAHRLLEKGSMTGKIALTVE